MKNSKFYVLPVKAKKCLKIVHLKRLKKRYVIISPSFISAMMKRNLLDENWDQLKKLIPYSDEDGDTTKVLASAISVIKTLKQQVVEMQEVMQEQTEIFEKMFQTPLKLLPRGMFPTQNGLALGLEIARGLGAGSYSPGWIGVMEMATMLAKLLRVYQQARARAAQNYQAVPTSPMAPATPGKPSTDDQEVPES